MPDGMHNCRSCTEADVAADACKNAAPQQLKAAEPGAACTVSAGTASCGPPTLQSLSGRCLPPQAVAVTDAANTPSVPTQTIVKSTSLLQPSVEAVVPGQTPKPAAEADAASTLHANQSTICQPAVLPTRLKQVVVPEVPLQVWRLVTPYLCTHKSRPFAMLLYTCHADLCV